jgi:hypothetical protein
MSVSICSLRIGIADGCSSKFGGMTMCTHTSSRSLLVQRGLVMFLRRVPCSSRVIQLCAVAMVAIHLYRSPVIRKVSMRA